jgi:1,4-dihydroxy-2-naphthoate octaprenyltransferase
MDLIRVHLIKSAKGLDPFLKRLALSTLAFTMLFCVGLLASHTLTTSV